MAKDFRALGTERKYFKYQNSIKMKEIEALQNAGNNVGLVIHEKHLLSAVPSRLVEVGQMITSKRTGKTLKCYNIMACYIGIENRFKHWEYSFWEEDKKKCKSVHHRVLQEWLDGVWSVVA